MELTLSEHQEELRAVARSFLEARCPAAEVRRLEALGARRIAKVRTWVVMEAPTGQRFCVVRAGRANFADQAKAWE